MPWILLANSLELFFLNSLNLSLLVFWELFRDTMGKTVNSKEWNQVHILILRKPLLLGKSMGSKHGSEEGEEKRANCSTSSLQHWRKLLQILKERDSSEHGSLNTFFPVENPDYFFRVDLLTYLLNLQCPYSIAFQGKSARKVWIGQVIKFTLENDNFSWIPSFDAENTNKWFLSLVLFTNSLCLKHK